MAVVKTECECQCGCQRRILFSEEVATEHPICFPCRTLHPVKNLDERRCESCGKDFTPAIECGFYLHFTLQETIALAFGTRNYFYCSRSCLEGNIEGVVSGLAYELCPPGKVEHIDLKPFDEEINN